MKLHAKQDQGFTLIELLVVCAIIGILGGIAIPAWNHHQKQGAVASVKSDLKNMSIYHEEYQVKHDGKYPTRLPQEGFPPSPDNILWLTPNGRCVIGTNNKYSDIIWNYDGQIKRVTQGPCPVDGTENQNPDPEDPDPTPVTPIGPAPGGGDITGIINASVFVGSPVAFTNQWRIIGNGTDLYVDGDFECNSLVTIHGDVYVEGNAYLTNSCYIGGSIWVKGTNTLMDSNAHIKGNLNTSGNVSIQSTNKIDGNINLGGTLTIHDGRTIEQLQASGALGGNVNEIEVNIPSATYPQAFFPTESTLPPVTWKDWLQEQATVHNPTTPAWAEANQGACTISPNQSWSLNGPIKVTTPTIVDARQATTGCSQITLGTSGGTIEIGADLVIYAEKIVLGNNLNFKATDPEGNHAVRIISPSNGGGATCGDGRIVDIKPGVKFDENLRMLFYSESSMIIGGTTSLRGQVMGGCVNASGTVEVIFAPVSIPQ